MDLDDYRHSAPAFFDERFPTNEQLPRKISWAIVSELSTGSAEVMLIDERGQPIGSRMTDNCWTADGYRFHDVMHVSFLIMLGWSPVLRGMLGRKRRSDARVDEIEDGGRAAVVEEAIVATVFGHAEDHNFMSHSSRLDRDLLRIIKRLTRHLEVGARTEAEWEEAIVTGLRIWHRVAAVEGGLLHGDAVARKVRFTELAGSRPHFGGYHCGNGAVVGE